MSTVGDMLRLARQLRGFTQIKAAKDLGIAQAVLSRHENGLAEPDNTVLTKAAQVFKLPRSFFDLLDPVYGPPVSVHPMLRGKANVSARDVDMITAELNIRLMHLRRLLDAVDFEPTLDIPPLDVEEFGSPEKIAGVVRAHWGVPSGPIKNLTALAERAGVIVGWSRLGGAAVSGVTYRAAGHPPLVLLNSQHPSDRMRFTLAHEIGHMVMHRFPTSTMEEEANEFASALLMPSNEISQSFQGRKITLQLLAALKPEWRVSMQSLLMRASSLRFLTGNQQRYLWQQISSRGWRTREPAELDFPHEIPTVLPAIIKTHVVDLGYTEDDLASLVRMHRGEFIEFYGESSPKEPDRPRLRIVK